VSRKPLAIAGDFADGVRTTVVVGALGAGLAIAIGWFLGTGAMAPVGVFAAVLVVMVAAARPELGVFILIAYLFGLDRLRLLGYLPYEVHWVWDVVVLALVLRVLADAARGRSIRIPRAALPWVALLTIVCATSILANSEPLATALVGLKQYFTSLVLVFALVNLCPGSVRLERIVLVLVLVACIQVPVSALQFLAAGRVADVNTGTLSLFSGPDMLVLVLFAVMVLVYLIVEGSVSRWVALLLPVLCLPPLFAGVRAALFFAPLVVVLSLIAAFGRVKRLNRVVGVLLVIVCFMLGTFVLVPSLADRVLGANMLTIDQAVTRETAQGVAGTGRVTALRQAAATLGSDPSYMLLGRGPGTASPSRIGGEALVGLDFNIQRSQVSLALVEVGWGGLIAIIFTVVALFLAAARRSVIRGGPWTRAAASSLLPWAALYLTMFVYTTIWRSYVPAMLLAIIVAARLAYGRVSGPETQGMEG